MWWAIALAATTSLVAVAYPSVAASASAFDAYTNSLPKGLVAVLGATAGFGSPAGYLNGKLYTSLFPLLVSVLGIGAAASSIAGAEAEGELDVVLAMPLSRRRLAWGRAAGVAAITALVAVAGTVPLAALAPATGLDAQLPAGAVWLAGLASEAMALTFAAVGFAAGAASGRRSLAVGSASVALAGSYLLYGLSGVVDALHPARWVLPWTWALESGSLGTGAGQRYWLEAVALPLAVATGLVAVGIARFVRRDLR